MDAFEAKQSVATLFDRVSDRYNAVGVEFFEPAARQLVAAAGPRTGERALDVGTGSGAVLRAVADAVGPTGHVTGIDLAPGMVDRARAAVAERGWTHVDVRLGDAEGPDVPAGSLDLVTCGLVLFFLPDPAGALRAYRAALRPGGRVALSTFFRDESVEAITGAVAAHVPEDVAATFTAGRRDSPFDHVDGVHALLTDAGFVDPTSVEEPVTVEFVDVEAWFAWSRSAALRGLWDAVPADRVPAAEADAAQVLDRFRGSDGRFHVPMPVRFTVAGAL